MSTVCPAISKQAQNNTSLSKRSFHWFLFENCFYLCYPSQERYKRCVKRFILQGYIFCKIPWEEGNCRGGKNEKLRKKFKRGKKKRRKIT